MFIKVKVFPESREDKIEKVDSESYHAFVRAGAQNGHANKVTTALLTKYFGSEARMVSGGTRQNKLFEIIERP
ncbi:MAG TPA: DUF167 family protein [Candidatus Paceibacterota bacterium]|nr:DUF167 family protein [Candidatus Paceibacterota bacterium]